jgi:hypothetical protein
VGEQKGKIKGVFAILCLTEITPSSVSAKERPFGKLSTRHITMGEWFDIILAVIALIRAEPLAGWTLLILLAAGALIAVLIRRSRREESLSLRR